VQGGADRVLGEALPAKVAKRAEPRPSIAKVREATVIVAEGDVLEGAVLQHHRVRGLVFILTQELDGLGVSGDRTGHVPQVGLGDCHPVEDLPLGVGIGRRQCAAQRERLGEELQSRLRFALLHVRNRQLLQAAALAGAIA